MWCGPCCATSAATRNGYPRRHFDEKIQNHVPSLLGGVAPRGCMVARRYRRRAWRSGRVVLAAGWWAGHGYGWVIPLCTAQISSPVGPQGSLGVATVPVSPPATDTLSPSFATI